MTDGAAVPSGVNDLPTRPPSAASYVAEVEPSTRGRMGQDEAVEVTPDRRRRPVVVADVHRHDDLGITRACHA